MVRLVSSALFYLGSFAIWLGVSCLDLAYDLDEDNPLWDTDPED